MIVLFVFDAQLYTVISISPLLEQFPLRHITTLYLKVPEFPFVMIKEPHFAADVGSIAF